MCAVVAGRASTEPTARPTLLFATTRTPYSVPLTGKILIDSSLDLRRALTLRRTPKGIEVMGPQYFGFDFDYQPIEKIQKNRPKFAAK